LRSSIDRWMSSRPASAFGAIVPLLRRTFGTFESAERRRLGQLLADGRREEPIGVGVDVDDGRASVILATVRDLIGLSAP